MIAATNEKFRTRVPPKPVVEEHLQISAAEETLQAPPPPDPENAVRIVDRRPPWDIRLLGIGPGFVPALFDRALMDDIVTVKVEDAFAACREVAAKEGLLVGITSGGSVHVALELARRPENAGKTICIVFADSGQGYLSVEGLF